MISYQRSHLVTAAVILALVMTVTPALPRAQAQGGMIAYGDVVSGRITTLNYFETWQFSGTKGDRVEILMEGDGTLDPYLGLLSLATEQVLAEDDDSGGGTDAYIAITLPSSGDFLIVATRYDLDLGMTEGRYTLALTGSGGPTSVSNPLTTNEPEEIEPGVFYMGDILLDAPVENAINDASYAHIYSLEAEAGTELMVAMVAAGSTLDSYLFFVDEAFDLLAEDDDSAAEFGGGALDAFINLTIPQTGVYYIVATRAGLDEGRTAGTYTLLAGVPEAEPEPAAQQETAEGLPPGVEFIAEIELGDTMTGTITEASFMHLYIFEGQANDEITITMTGSDGLDAYLGLFDPADEIIAEDDDSLGGLDAVISLTLPQSGTYLIVATRNGIDMGTTSGDYTLELSTSQPEPEAPATGLNSFGGLPGRAIAAEQGTLYLRGNGRSNNPAKSPPVEAFFGLDSRLPGMGSPLTPLLHGTRPHAFLERIAGQ